MWRRLSLDKLANVCIIVAAVFVSVSYARAWFITPPPPVAGASRPSYAVGESVPVLGGVSYEAAGRSLVFFVNSGCHFCTASMPFYQSLVQRRNELKAPVQFVGASIEKETELRKYLDSHGVTLDRLATLGSRTDYKLALTPTLLLLDKTGKVQRMWTGALDQKQEQELLTALGL
jgi:peroxiredoxin